MPIRVSVERFQCEGHGICVRVAPELFRLDDEGRAETILEEVPDALRLKALLAERQCPAEAIIVRES